MPIVVDIETYDPHLKDFGCGAIRKDGCILGIGVYDGTTTHYFAPTDERVKNTLANSETKIFHNGVYDLDWLVHGQGLTVNGRIEDTMTREYLLDAYAGHYDLGHCCERRGVEGKNKEGTIELWWKQNGGKGKAVEHLDQVPSSIVGEYCKQDCKATYDLYMAQGEELTKQGLDHANDIESRLYPVILEMKKNGLRLDNRARGALSEGLNERYEKGMRDLQEKYPWLTSLGAPSQLQKIWYKEGIPVTLTGAGSPSFAADVLERCEHPVAKKIHELRNIQTALNKFVDGAIVDYQYNEHLHPTFYPALRDEGGTVTGRFSCRDPNVQQISARDEKFGTEIRSLFVPEEGCILGAFDYKQIEYVVFTHYASGPGADDARALITEGKIDYHTMVMNLLGWDDRHLAKNMNFGSLYGLGAKSFAERFRGALLKYGPDVFETAKYFMDEYFRKVPFVRPTCRSIQDAGVRYGYVLTKAGRRQRMPHDNKAYKLVNYLVQGTASDVLKAGLVSAHEAGVFNVLKLHGTVHDENVFSIPLNREGFQAAEEFARIMCDGIKLKVPIRVDKEAGPDWGHCTSDYYEEMKRRAYG